MVANIGSDTYGTCSNKFLDKEFKTVRYELKVTVNGDSSFSYEKDTPASNIKSEKPVSSHRQKYLTKSRISRFHQIH